jgi:translation initiation factor 3 subunit D
MRPPWSLTAPATVHARRRLASEDAGRVFMTDSVLTTLMCSTRSVYSWDIVVTRAGDKLFFDKRDSSGLDDLTVAETAPESVAEEKENINGVQLLSREATAINQNFSQQVRGRLEGACLGP